METCGLSVSSPSPNEANLFPLVFLAHLDVHALKGLRKDVSEHADNEASRHARLERVRVKKFEVGAPDLPVPTTMIIDVQRTMSKVHRL